MKRAVLLLLPLILSACAPQGSNTSQMSSYGSCVVPASSRVANLDSASELRDPFEFYGKVQLDSSGGSGALQTNERENDRESAKLQAGQQLTVTVKGACDLSSFTSEAATQAGAESPRSFTLTLERDTTLRELREKAEADDCVLGISESTHVFVNSEAMASELDPLVSDQSHLLMLGANKILSSLTSFSSKPVVIAVIDTGVDADHEEFKGLLWENSKETPDNGVDDDQNGYIDDFNGYNFAQDIPSPRYSGDWNGYQHGTHVAGLALARGFNGLGGQGVLGSGAKLMALNVFGNEAAALSANVANAIRYAADQGASVINMSVGGLGRNPVYESAIVYAIKKGAVVVAAVGNESNQMSEDYFLAPAAYAPQIRGMLSVGSVDARSGAYSSFSNFGSQYVELAAPGTESAVERIGLLSTWPGGSYKRLQGTSMASPIASGAAALTFGILRSRGYRPSPGTIEDILRASAYPVRRLDDKVNGGRSLNLERLVTFVEKYYPPGGSGDPGLRGVKSCESSNNL